MREGEREWGAGGDPPAEQSSHGGQSHLPHGSWRYFCSRPEGLCVTNSSDLVTTPSTPPLLFILHHFSVFWKRGNRLAHLENGDHLEAKSDEWCFYTQRALNLRHFPWAPSVWWHSEQFHLHEFILKNLNSSKESLKIMFTTELFVIVKNCKLPK